MSIPIDVGAPKGGAGKGKRLQEITDRAARPSVFIESPGSESPGESP